ncbi:3-isopropylmalate dehydratase small subunit [Cysteiniphilum sp. QT6929]|uniref:3-isopropylmalate dehydratase small subunit n=1 Tax=Cysteiniphilum sp. QT6929 TaxID=2975055 RepID=UPI0024B39BE9|nr:3-isopropylmalate dehydratase small subunit [Cysteiniphilum sp. QT6929]WHN65045.1 3-isopropylmalate dehydratase small subunit [Cysteiniphilum sp. QT6929]
MKAFQTLTSKAIPMWLSDVDTDMIIPAQYLTQTTIAGYGEHLFTRLKSADPEFVFNQSRFKDARILISGSNFGCGSSREHAVWALQQAGVAVILAPSFSDIFFNNSAKNGLLLIALDGELLEKWCEKAQSEDLDITVDLAAQTITVDGESYHFDYDPFRKECLLQGQDDMGYLLSKDQEISRFETMLK